MLRTLFVAAAIVAVCVHACDLSPLEPEQCPQPCESACPQPPAVQVAVPPDCPGLPCMSECSNGCLEHFAGMATHERHCRHERHTIEAAWDAYHKEVAIRDAIIADRENVQRREVINEADHKAEHKLPGADEHEYRHRRHHHHHHRHHHHREHHRRYYEHERVETHVSHHRYHAHEQHFFKTPTKKQQNKRSSKKNKRKSYDYEQDDDERDDNDDNDDDDDDDAAYSQSASFVSHPASLPVFAPFAHPIISRTRVSFHHVGGVHSTQLPTHDDLAAGMHAREQVHGHWHVFALPAHTSAIDVHAGHSAYSHIEHHEHHHHHSYYHHHHRRHSSSSSSSSYRVLVHRRLDTLRSPHGYIGSSAHAAHRAMVAAYRRAVHRHCAQSHHLSKHTWTRTYSVEHREACAGRIFAQIERDPNAFPSQHEISRIAARQRVQHKSVAMAVHHFHFVPPPHVLAPEHLRHHRHHRRHHHHHHHRRHEHHDERIEEDDRVIKEHDELRFGLEIPEMPQQPTEQLSPECDASNDGDSELYLQLCMCECEKRCEAEENEFKARVAEENMLTAGSPVAAGGATGLGPMHLPPLPGTAAAMGGGVLSDYGDDQDADEQRRILEEVEAHHVEHLAEERAASSAFSGVANAAAAAVEGAPHVVTAHERFLGDENAPDAPVHWFAFDQSADDADDVDADVSMM